MTRAHFGHDEWEPCAPGLKTLDDTTANRQQLLSALEQSERTPDLEREQELLAEPVGERR